VENPLPERPPRFRLGTQAPQQQDRMQHNHLETPVNRIRHAVILVKNRCSRLRHDRAIEGRDVVVLRGAAKQVKYHRGSSSAWDRHGDSGILHSGIVAHVELPATATDRRTQRDMGMQQGMHSPRAGRPRPRALALAALLLLGLPLGGCFSETYQKGYIVPEGALEQILISAIQEEVVIL